MTTHEATNLLMSWRAHKLRWALTGSEHLFALSVWDQVQDFPYLVSQAIDGRGDGIAFIECVQRMANLLAAAGVNA